MPRALAQTFGLKDENCYIFEANPDAAEYIMKTYPEMKLFNNIITDVKGILDFNVEPYHVGSSSMLKRLDSPKEGMKVVKVESASMEEVIDSLNIQTIDVCKIDVEGVTLNVLKSFGKHLDKLQSVQLKSEYKEYFLGETLYPEIREWLLAHDYTEILCCLQRKCTYDSFWLKNSRMLL